jgi:hypothetical protein
VDHSHEVARRGAMSTHRMRSRFYVESVVAVVTGGLALLTAFSHDWIEALTGVDPDHHNGSVELLIVAALAVTSVTLVMTAGLEWNRRARVA